MRRLIGNAIALCLSIILLLSSAALGHAAAKANSDRLKAAYDSVKDRVSDISNSIERLITGK